MAVDLSPIGGAGAQFFDNNGVPLSGGKLYTYAAATTTPKASYTSGSGNVPHSNPIILDSAGRVPGGEIWLTTGEAYKFVLETPTGILLGTWDNIYGYTTGSADASTEVQIATAGQTLFVLNQMAYTPGSNTLGVYIDGVNQVVNNAYIETNATSVTFVSGLHEGAVVKFINVNIASTDANVVTYEPGFTGSQATTVEEKLQETVNLRDFMTPAQKADVDAGTLSVDTSSAWQAAFDYASGKYKTSLQTGVLLRVAGGRYLVNQQVLNTWRNTDAIVDAGDRRKLTIQGDGSANTVIFSGVPSGNTFEFKGYGNGSGTMLDLVIKGLTINQKDLGSTRVANGIATTQISHLFLEDVVIGYFNIGWVFNDTINVMALGCQFLGNTVGASAAVSVFANPNIVAFYRCNFGGNKLGGLRTTSAANLKVDTCGFEGNGSSRVPADDNFSLKLLQGPSEGGASALVQNCYFESNNVYTDVSCEWGSANSGTIKVEACSFNRTNNTIYAYRHIVMSQVGAGILNVSLDANAYKAFGTYTPGANPCWEVTTTNVNIGATNEYYTPTERPATNNLPALRNNGRQLIAAGFVNADGTTVYTYNCTVTKGTAGQYTINYTNRPSSLNVGVEAILYNSFGYITFYGNTLLGLVFLTSDTAAVLTDKQFNFSIYGNPAY